MTRMTKVLVIDDDNVNCENIRMFLEKEGYEVYCVSDGLDAIPAFRSFDPDIILSEVLLPSRDGWQICITLRTMTTTPIIFMSTKCDSVDKSMGLEFGADDYIGKPFDIKELYARIKAVLRRTKQPEAPENECVKFDNLEISIDKYELRLNDKNIDLPPKELELLYFLASNYNHVFTRDQLLDKVWSFDYLGDSRTVDVHIKRLREKLAGASDKWAIETVWGVGYKFKVYNE